MIGLMVVHGAAAGNFSPLNVLGGHRQSGGRADGYDVVDGALFIANLAYNLALAGVIVTVFGRRGPACRQPRPRARWSPRARHA